MGCSTSRRRGLTAGATGVNRSSRWCLTSNGYWGLRPPLSDHPQPGSLPSTPERQAPCFVGAASQPGALGDVLLELGDHLVGQGGAGVSDGGQVVVGAGGFAAAELDLALKRRFSALAGRALDIRGGGPRAT